MTKRSGNFNEVTSKKLKIDDNLADLWGDDPNFDDIEDCLLLATQVCEQEALNCSQRNNVSILPNYSIFRKDSENIITSTQTNDIGRTIGNQDVNEATSSNFIKPHSYVGNKVLFKNSITNNSNVNELENEIRELKEKYESKEGEVSILRIQLKETKINLDAEHQKKEKEWTEKLNVTKKEISSVKSELEFKNLEVVNLKNKLLEISKAYSTENLSNGFQHFKVTHTNFNTNIPTSYALQPILEASYPLMKTISPVIFNSASPENFFLNLKSNQIYNAVNGKEDNEVLEKHKNIIESKYFKLDNVFYDISALMNTNSINIDSIITRSHIDQIIFISNYTLSTFRNYLLYLEDNMRNEDVRQEDVLYLEKKMEQLDLNLSVFDPRCWCEKEIGIRARQTVAIVAEVFPYSGYLQRRVLNNDAKRINDTEFENYLTLIFTIITIIGRIRKAYICEGFLCSVAILLTRIAQMDEFSQSYSLVSKILKELIFTRPATSVLKNIILFLKHACVNLNFVKDLCLVPGSSLQTHNKEGTLYFNQDSCILQVFMILYEHSFINSANVNIDVRWSTLQFIMNLLKSNSLWLHYQENNNCDCLCKVNTLAVNVVNDCIKNYKKERRKPLSKHISRYHEILKYSIKILRIINFKYIDIINKYPIDSQYKFIVKYLLSVKDEIRITEFEYEILRELCLQDDLPTNLNLAFDKIPILQ